MLNIGSKIYRNLQEQVGFNTECIEKIVEYLDGVSLDDKLIVIPSTSGTLTDEEFDVASKKLAFMATSSDVYIKSEEDASDIVFRQVKLVATAIGTTNFELRTNKITVSKITKAYVGSTDSVLAVYSKDQIDTLLSAKANLTGANFTGAVTALTLEQQNANYSANITFADNANYSFQNIYNRLEVLNNILYLVVNVKATRLTDGSVFFISAVDVTLPAELASKIYDLEGNPATQAKDTPILVTADMATGLTTITTTTPDISSKSLFIEVTNYYGSNHIAVALRGLGSATTAGDVLYITGRIPLTLI